jgi:RNA 2',3'-cyclic 3'-phosphodiesterase
MRLFVALDLPTEVRAALVDLILELKPLCRAAIWARPEGMHVTLKFIGHAIADVDAGKLAAARTSLATVRSAAPVEIRYRGIGFFPNARRPRVMWCGIDASANLAPLAGDIERSLEPLGIPREERPFLPHLTIARFKSTEGVNAIARKSEEFAERDFGSSRETEFYLFESKLKPGGAEYRRIESYSFVGTAA